MSPVMDKLKTKLSRMASYANEQLDSVVCSGAVSTWKKYRMDVELANIDLVLGFIITAIILAVGVIILYNFETATPAIDANSTWYTTQATIRSTTQSGYGLMVVILIIIAAMGLIGVLLGIRRNK